MLHFPDRLSANNRRLGYLLLQRGCLTESQLLFALEKQHQQPQPLGQLLQKLEWISQATLKKVLRQQQRLEFTATVMATLLPVTSAEPSPSPLPLLELPDLNCWLTTQLSHSHQHSELRVEQLTLLCTKNCSCAFFCLHDHRDKPMMLRCPVNGFAARTLPSGLVDHWPEITLAVRLDGAMQELPVLLRPQQRGEQALPKLCLSAGQLSQLAPQVKKLVAG